MRVNTADPLVFEDTLTEAGEREAVTPVGRPETERLTLPEKPYDEPIEKVEVAVCPCPKVKYPNPEMVKLGVWTLRWNVLDWV